MRAFAVGALSFSPNYLGAEIGIDLVQPANDPTLRWIKLSSYTKRDVAPDYQLTIIGIPNDTTVRPYYYTEQADQGAHLPEAYRIQGGNWNFGDPGDYVWDNWYFPVSVTQNAMGVASKIVVHDGIHLSALTHVEKPVPEPTTLAALGLGLVSILRRRTRR
ncbi:PEP-CTERM sorting domain-containing protein [bacterium]|nr:MAG: PEP-CTERM sorting domain-containing protein [bacterium]